MKKDMEDPQKIKYAKPLWHWILLSFVDLKASLHNQKHNPNPKRLEAAQEIHLQTWNFLSKKSNSENHSKGRFKS